MITNSFKSEGYLASMADERLVSYIKKQLAAGYSIDSIRASLIRYGYNPAAVEEAIRAVQKPAVKIPVIPIAIGAAVLIVIVVLFFVLRAPAPKQLLDLKTTAVVYEVRARESLTFNVELINMGVVRRYDVSLIHQIIDSADKIVNSQQESIAIETRASSTSQIAVPADTPAGRYKLQTVAYYNAQTAESFFMFDVKAPPEEVPPEEIEVAKLECPPSCDDFDECTRDYCGAETGYECVHEPIVPCCGNGECETGEDYINCPADCPPPVIEVEIPPELTFIDVIARAEELGAEDPEKGAKYCSELAGGYRDSCYCTLAETVNNSIYCTPIVSDVKRDSCYTTFALAGDYTVCKKLVDKWLRDGCIELSRASGLVSS